jgi:hypothetical protein
MGVTRKSVSLRIRDGTQVNVVLFSLASIQNSVGTTRMSME